MAKFDKVIPPGQEGKIILEIDAARVHGSFRKAATVKSNDPEHPTIALTLAGQVKPYLEVKPSDRVFLRGVYGESVSQTLEIISNEGKPFEITGVTSNIDDKITYKLIPTPEKNKYELRIWKNPALPTLNTWGNITLTTTSEKAPEKVIQVNVNTRGSILVNPTVLNFGLIRIDQQKRSPNGIERKLVVFKTTGEFRIKDITFSSDRYRAKVETLMPGKRYQVKIRFKPGEQRRAVSDEMVIHTDDPHESTVKVRLIARLI